MRKTALITGASRGIGRACAVAFANAGYDLHLNCIHSAESLTALAGELEASYHISCRTHIGDIGDFAFAEKMFARISHLDVLINNAGISHIGLLQDMTPEEWGRVMSTNLTSSFYTCKCAIPIMLAQGHGRILNVSSIWGNAGGSTEVAYSAAKGGLNAFTKALAKELAPSNIQVNAAAFGVIDTDMNSCFSPEEKKALQEEIPAGRMGTPEEAAALLLQLAQSPDYLTGQIITMDGGFL